jgi:phosphoglycerate dehydrogenase-like enzyme
MGTFWTALIVGCGSTSRAVLARIKDGALLVNAVRGALY